MFKNKIGFWTKKKGIKHNHLANLCAVSPQTFSSWVKNTTQPDLKQAAIIAKALSVSLDDLIEWEDEYGEGKKTN